LITIYLFALFTYILDLFGFNYLLYYLVILIFDKCFIWLFYEFLFDLILIFDLIIRFILVRIIFDLIFVFTQILLNIRLIFDDLFRVNVFIPHNLSKFLDIINLFLWLFPHNYILRMIFLNLIIFFRAIFLFLWIRNLFIWLSDAWALLSWLWILNIFDLQIFLCIFNLVIKRAVLIRLFLIFIILLIIHWLIFVIISFFS
jgi:hypothetical protein